jgi:uncharacterized membrane protein
MTVFDAILFSMFLCLMGVGIGYLIGRIKP